MNQKKIFLVLVVVFAIISAGLFFSYKTKTKAEGVVQKSDPSTVQNNGSLRDDPEFTSPTVENTEESTWIKNNNHYERFKEDIKADATDTTISLQFFGDIMLDRNVAKAMGSDGLDYLFKNIAGESAGLYHHADLLVANLEGAFAPTRVPTTKSIAFRFDPTLALQLKKYQFDVVSLANNHSLDMGWKNVDFTKKILDEAGIGYFGTQTKESKDLTWVAEIPGKTDKVAFIGLNNTDHVLDMPRVTESIEDAKEKARYVIVFMHWGVEYKRISREQERVLARTLIDKGASAVIGAHPHVVQEMEIYQGKPIFYSLGNFVFDQYFSQETQEGLSVGLVLKDGAVKTIYAFPFYGIKSQVQLMEPSRRDEFLNWLNENSRLKGKKFEQGKLEL
jgi:poly-gamma-glutamate synthesis protein (capsule biosynthesis protein)